MSTPVALLPLLAAVVLLLPATANAGAGSHARASQAATSELAEAAAAGKRKTALRALRVSRHEAAVASRAARTLAVEGDLAGAARAARATARAYDANLSTYTSLLATAEPAVSTAVSRALIPTLNGREQAVALLQQLIPLLPEAARPALARAIAALSRGAAADAQQMAGALQSPRLPVAIRPIVTSAFAAASAWIQTALSHLEGLVGALPPIARAPVQSALRLVESQLTMVQGIVDQVLGLVGGVTGGVSGGTTLPGLGMLAWIPGLGGGATSTAGRVLDAVSGLLGSRP